MALRIIIALTFIVACTFIGSIIHIGSGNGAIIGFIVGFVLGCIVLSYRSSNKEVSQKDVEKGSSQARKIIGPSGRR
jgi:hypothetical protein